MNRRRFLAWVNGIIAVGCAAVVAVPGVRFILATVRNREPAAGITQRVARLADLVPQVPVQATIIGVQRDAWTLHPAQSIGRVWLVRRDDDSVPPASARVDAFSDVCPHLGCTIHLAPSRDAFLCPCHKGAFDLAGARVPAQKLGRTNPAPRALDGLACRIVEDEQTKEWWVEVEYHEFVQGLTMKVSTS